MHWSAGTTDGSNCELSVLNYISFSLHYPLPTARFITRDLLTFVGKSGMSSLTANYLDLSPANDEKIKDYKSGWRAIWESQGIYAALVMVLRASPLTATLELGGSAVFVAIFGCFLLGCLRIRRIDSESAFCRPRAIALVMMALFPLYVFATSEVSADMLSRYRYPSEFAICILAVLGGSTLKRFTHRRIPNGD